MKDRGPRHAHPRPALEPACHRSIPYARARVVQRTHNPLAPSGLLPPNRSSAIALPALPTPMRAIDRIIVIIPAQLGDVLLCTPLIHAARSEWPQARIDVLGLVGTLGLLKGNPEVDELIEISRTGGLRAQWRQARTLWRRYDLALVGRSNDRAHLYGLIAGRMRSAILPGEGAGSLWKRLVARHGLVQKFGEHQVLERLQLLGAWRGLPPTVSLEPPAALPLPAEIQTQLRHPCVVVQVPSMWRYKQWPVAHFRTVIERLLADGVQVVLTGSGSDNDQSLVDGVRGLAPAPDLLDVAGRVDLGQVRTLLDHADAYLGPDTSITHLAAAVGLPIVTVFGPTPPDAFGPWPKQHPPSQPWQTRATRQQVGRIVVLQGPDLPGRRCVPCGLMGCEHRLDSPSRCLEGLEPQRVLAELRSILQARLRA
jgi:heptosyltransferase-3